MSDEWGVLRTEYDTGGTTRRVFTGVLRILELYYLFKYLFVC